jgi:hypothetical protein
MGSQPSPCGRADKSLARSGSDFRGGVTTLPRELPAGLPLPEFAVGLRHRTRLLPSSTADLAQIGKIRFGCECRPSRKGRAGAEFMAANQTSVKARTSKRDRGAPKARTGTKRTDRGAPPGSRRRRARRQAPARQGLKKRRGAPPGSRRRRARGQAPARQGLTNS